METLERVTSISRMAKGGALISHLIGRLTVLEEWIITAQVLAARGASLNNNCTMQGEKKENKEESTRRLS